MSESPQPNLGFADDRSLHLRFWLLIVATGALAGLGAASLTGLLHVVVTFAWGPDAATSLLDAVRSTSSLHRVLVLLAAGVLVIGGRFAFRRATGGHGAELVERVWFGDGRLPFVTTCAQAVLSIVLVGLGTSLGREAAPKQAGAAIGSLLSHRAGLSPAHCRLATAIGAGAGISAVYDVPLGGALFALEVLVGSIALPLVPPALVASGIAVAVARLFLPSSSIYHVAFTPISPALIAWASVFGPLAGACAALYARLIAAVDAMKPRSNLGLVVVPVIVFAALGALSIPLPQLLGNGQDAVQLAFNGRIALPLLAVLAIAKPLVTAACLGSGAPGGLLTPTLMLGAMLGGATGSVWSMAWPGSADAPYAMVGAAAFLAAASQGPVSAVILVLELTRRLDTLMVPIVLAVGGAVLAARLLGARSLYAGRVHQGRKAADAQDGSRAVISAAARYAELLQHLLRAAARGVPLWVVDKDGAPLGLVDDAQARDPSRTTKPLEAATARDFIAGDTRP